MEALCVNHFFHYKNSSSIQQLRCKSMNYRRPRFLFVSSCQNNEQTERSSTSKSTTKKEEKGKKKELFSQFFAGVEKFGKGLKENMSPKQKGDWKDLMLMSLSFAVYVYMSQMIVCAYCSWMSMPQASW